MNMESTHFEKVDVSVESYDDGIYNLRIRKSNLQEEKIEIDKSEAERVCELLGEELPEAEPSPPEQWG